MADPNSAANSGEPIDVAAITKTVTDAVLASIKPTLDATTQSQAELAKNHRILADTLEKLPPAKADKETGEPGDKGKPAPDASPLTPEAITKMITEAIAADRQQQQTTQAAKSERDSFVGSEASGLARLPAAYQNQLGPDRARWADEAKAIVHQWEADFKAAGGTVANLGGANREGGDATGGANGQDAAGRKKFSGLAEGTEKFAGELKIPAA
jgi:hypothetical protein